MGYSPDSIDDLMKKQLILFTRNVNKDRKRLKKIKN